MFLVVKFSIYLNRRVFVMWCRVEAVKCLPVLHYSVVNIFWSFVITEPITGVLKVYMNV